jgi:hypothetical protein
MKRTTLYLSLTAGILFAVVLMLNPNGASGSHKAPAQGPGTEMPDSILKIVQRACMDCHSDDGSSMARSKVNFSKWSTYDAEKQMKKSVAMCKELSKAAMPPKKWRANNAEAIPTQAEVEKICAWSKAIQK